MPALPVCLEGAYPCVFPRGLFVNVGDIGVSELVPFISLLLSLFLYLSLSYMKYIYQIDRERRIEREKGREIKGEKDGEGARGLFIERGPTGKRTTLAPLANIKRCVSRQRGYTLGYWAKGAIGSSA